MLELYQFEASHACEKVRLILDYKQLSYRPVEVTPGWGQVDLYRFSGQHQVPVLKDGATVVGDSTAIATYLDRQYPERPLIPTEPLQRGQCLLIEAWADEVLGMNAYKAMVGAWQQHPNFRTALLPSTTPDVLKSWVAAVPADWLKLMGTGIGFGKVAVKAATVDLRQVLESLCLILRSQPYLLGTEPSLADLAVAGMSMYLKFPPQEYVNLPAAICGKGLPGLADVSEYAAFWTWRERLYGEFRRPRR